MSESEIAALASYPSVSESEVSALESQSSVETDQEPQSLSESQGVSLSGSVHGKRILTNYSPEMIKYRAEQAESGTPVNDRILSCVRAVKTEDGRIFADQRCPASFTSLI